MKHTKVWTIPDCPKCGKEMRGSYRYDTKLATRQKPFGVAVGKWYCECGYDGEEFVGKPYDTILYNEVVE